MALQDFYNPEYEIGESTYGTILVISHKESAERRLLKTIRKSEEEIVNPDEERSNDVC
jgi:hypothetical protein